LKVVEEFRAWVLYARTTLSPVLADITKDRYVKQLQKVLDYFEVRFSKYYF
jgi:hypothetical protein